MIVVGLLPTYDLAGLLLTFYMVHKHYLKSVYNLQKRMLVEESNYLKKLNILLKNFNIYRKELRSHF